MNRTLLNTPPGSELGRALAAIPEVDGLRAALARVRAQRFAAVDSDGEKERRSLIANIADEIASGKDYPADAGARMAEVQAQIAAARAANDVRSAVENRLTSMLEQAIDDDRDLALDVIRAGVGEVLDEARTLDRHLGSAETADQAITAGGKAVTAWGRLGELVDRYLALRRAHLEVVRPDGHGDAEWARLVREQGEVRHRDTLWAGRTPPWPHVELHPEDGPTRDRAGLRWLATALPDSDAHVWCPDLAQMRAADEEQVERRTAPADAPDFAMTATASIA
ncbi:hypothetical protein ACQPX6_10275 [Actinomycetospora sp. CA-101289]|uniref:hypothetical protein n=1 Tax=Actinomycetospora sp. CA-101289 TaxID=3239893 RepID=UPI003D95734A